MATKHYSGILPDLLRLGCIHWRPADLRIDTVTYPAPFTVNWIISLTRNANFERKLLCVRKVLASVKGSEEKN